MKKLVAYFSATGKTQTLAENLENGLMFIFRAKSRIFMWNIDLKRECHFKNKFGIFLKTLPLAKRLAMATLLALLQGKWENKKCLPKQLVQTQFA